MVHLTFILSVTGTYHLRLLLGRLRGQSVLAVWTSFGGAHACVRITHQPQVRGWHCIMLTKCTSTNHKVNGYTTFIQYSLKRAETRNLKRFLKKTLPKLRMDGWRHWLDKVHKQGEHIPQLCYISHNHPYMSRGDTLDSLLLRDGCVKCRNVVECSPCLYTLSASASIQPPLRLVEKSFIALYSLV